MLLFVFLLCSVEQLILLNNMRESAALLGMVIEQNRIILHLNHNIYSYRLSTTCLSQFQKILENYTM